MQTAAVQALKARDFPGGTPSGSREKLLVFLKYPLVMTSNSLLLKIAIEIVDFPIDSMVIFHSFLYVYQRVANPKFKLVDG